MHNLSAGGASVLIKGQTPKQFSDKLESLIDNKGFNIQKGAPAYGSAYVWSAPWYSKYSLQLQLHDYNSTDTILRIDSNLNMEKAFQSIFDKEFNNETYPKSFPKKNIFFTSALTLLAPAAGHLFLYSDTPFQNSAAWTEGLQLLGIDVALFFLGSKTFFTHSVDPFDRGLVATAILLGGYRLFYLIPALQVNLAQNEIIEMGYNFQF